MKLKEKVVYVGQFIPRNERVPTVGKEGTRRFNNCYVKNFGTTISEDELRQLFSEFGQIESARIMYTNDGASRGFGFVCFTECDSAETAVKSLNGKVVDGRELFVGRAQLKSERKEELRIRYA